jgi:hypothetical protein
MRKFRMFVAAAALLGGAALAGCTSTRPAGIETVTIDSPFEFEDRAYRFQLVADDFILHRRVDGDGRPGEITGWVREVFRVSRYDLGQGRWAMHESLPGCYIQWHGGEDFAIARSRAELRGAEVALLR